MTQSANIENVTARIAQGRIIPVVRAANFDEAARAVDAIYAGGISIMEITLTVPNAVAVIRQVTKQFGDSVLTGAGTVLTAQQAEECLDAGAQFLVSPGFSPSVLVAAKARSILAIPGVLTPTELMNALAAGASLMKVFPCSNVGGPKYLKALKGPFPQVSMIPTGGVNASNAADYLAAGAFALGIGGDLCDTAAIRSGNAAKVTAAARELVEAVKNFNQPRGG